MSSLSPSSKSAPFRPRARLLRTIGDELVSSETVAITELVKNSYDADASFVLIRFTGPLKTDKGQIEIIDDGHGMSLETIQNSWMEPANSNKKQNNRSPKLLRRVLGNKGVGRFAASRLAHSLEIITRAKNSSSEVTALFDWRQFDDESKYLDEIEVLWDETEPDEIKPDSFLSCLDFSYLEGIRTEGDHGTILRAGELRNSWTRKNLTTLKSSLSRLVSPFEASIASGFSIYLQLPVDFRDLSGKIEPPDSLGSPHYKIFGRVYENGSCALTSEQFVMGEKLQQSIEASLAESGKSLKCGSFDVDFRVWDLDDLDGLAKKRQVTIRDIKKDLKSAAGINVYRDGFRVLPYGEPNNDWLRLDMRRVQNPTMRLSNNQIVGYISISADRNPELQDQSNREGLMDGQAVEDLQKLVIEVLIKLEAIRYIARRRPESNEAIPELSEENSLSNKFASHENLFGGLDFAPVRKVIQDKYSNDAEIISLFEYQEKKLERSVTAVKEALSRYQRLATLGQLIDTILHDGRAPIFKIDTESAISIRKIENEIKKNGESAFLETLKDKFSAIKDQSVLISSLFRRIEPFGGRKRGRPKNLILEDVISDTFSILENEIDRLGIEVQLPRSKTKVTLEQSEIQQIVLNLLENSIVWLRKVPKETRKISVSILRKSAASIELFFSDSGPGIESKYRDKIFEPYFSLKKDGVGLGLTIVGEIVTEYYDGRLELMDNGPLSGATFRVLLNKRV
ncbi:histidine kinase [[Leptolyngbya] sp. PCC 7376]|uniref:sensor histidine kinase n=1 Tax=[Leptolyngbya] sp. PCC 7376 TaxID=111781 RepID=UPI00029F199E|nr:ATP-binding protein [[Leptolyngbya] sp. PCC 7376]AFY37845.1 histidine kinase [[Leptolyngbya] sp. PCC 7376]